LTAVSTSGVTVPVFGFGMRPRGPSNLTELTDDAHGVGRGDDHVEIHHAALDLLRELFHADEVSAPAALALSAASPWVNTATRTSLPVPCGRVVAPRTAWSDLRASTPSLTATSTVSLNFAVARSLSRPTASSNG
jgi:hypothetical protein